MCPSPCESPWSYAREPTHHFLTLLFLHCLEKVEWPTILVKDEKEEFDTAQMPESISSLGLGLPLKMYFMRD